MASRVVKGISWSALERFSVQAVQFVVSVVLARLLTPEIFGLVALALVIINILQTINEVGFGAALIQKQDRDELDFSSVFVLNMLLGFFLYGILFLLAPYLSLLFGNEELTSVVRWIGLNLIITSFVVVQRTKLFIAVDFKTMAKASLIAAFISGTIGVFLAYRGMGVMALVIQALLNNFINTLFIWLYVEWRPKLQFSCERFRSLYNFASKLILSRLINVFFNEVYSVVIGVFYSPAQLGLFNRAKSFESLSTNNITTIVQRVSVPLLCEQQNDKVLMGNTLIRFISNTALIVYPLLFSMIVLAKPLVLVLLTDKWLEVVWILQILCPVGFFYLISTFNRNIFNATGRTDWALKSEIIKKIIALVFIFISVIYGFTAFVCSSFAIALIELIIDTYYTKKQIGLGLGMQIKSVLPIFVSSVIMALIVYFNSLFFESQILKLITGVIVGAFSYIILCYVFNICDFRNILKKLKI